MATPHITLRIAGAQDQVAVARLAALDSAKIPEGPLLLAEVDGQPKAAISLDGETVIADPFSRTVHLVELLRMHAATISDPGRAPRRRGRARRITVPGNRAPLSQPAHARP